MTINKKNKLPKLTFRRLYYRMQGFPWGNAAILIICGLLASFVFYQLNSTSFEAFDTTATLTNLLTVNGVFSAILITYLFSRIIWTKDRKLELLREAISISQKITEFRRILNKLTYFYDVWDNDKQTKSLIDYGKFKHIDFYDYRLKMISDYEPANAKLIDEFYKHGDFSEGKSTLYLAMVSLVRDRKSDYQYQKELYKDFKHKEIYNFKIVERWLECEIMGIISSRLAGNTNWIKYLALRNEKAYILAAATRIDKKYEGQELNNELIKEIADDMSSYYLNELYVCLMDLKKGINDLNLLIIILISFSLFFGVLTPFILLLVSSKELWFTIVVALTAAINTGLMSYFIFRFPFLINKELKWT